MTKSTHIVSLADTVALVYALGAAGEAKQQAIKSDKKTTASTALPQTPVDDAVLATWGKARQFTPDVKAAYLAFAKGLERESATVS